MKNIVLAAAAVILAATCASAQTTASVKVDREAVKTLSGYQADICLLVGHTVKTLGPDYAGKPRINVNDQTYKAFGHFNRFIADMVYRGVNGENTALECVNYAPLIFGTKLVNGQH